LLGLEITVFTGDFLQQVPEGKWQNFVRGIVAGFDFIQL
jgi:hypothetical protein